MCRDAMEKESAAAEKIEDASASMDLVLAGKMS
jgi:hypothetical protein